MKHRAFIFQIQEATFGVFAEENIIIQAPDKLHWMLGKSLQEIKPYLLEVKARVTEVKV